MESKEKKQIPLRVSKELFVELQRWADDEFRSINGQIEYLLTECVKERRNPKNFENQED
ncbi:MAG: Arc family DNA-binding protein [Clostridia bacterium]|nr:Arc family DNA-binding protein [Clostridia bacterium]